MTSTATTEYWASMTTRGLAFIPSHRSTEYGVIRFQGGDIGTYHLAQRIITPREAQLAKSDERWVAQFLRPGTRHMVETQAASTRDLMIAVQKTLKPVSLEA